ncbi:RidA family protein [Chloroflexota bacterium]
MPKEIIAPENVHRARGYSHAIKCGNTIYVAGQIALDEKGKLVGESDVVAQTGRAYENLKRVLEAAGASMSDIVVMHVYTMDLEGFKKTWEIGRKYFGTYSPAITVIGVVGLYEPGTIIEIEAIAVVD